MISLQDKIQKFQKSIYNKDLDDFIPIDEQFIGGGITMQSLIKENAFIVEQIKKMKNVFVNYCKLNKTVYQKITEHEIALHTQTNKIHSVSSSVEQKLGDAIKQVKQMYEEMKYESVRTKKLVDQAVRPIEEAINRKVDQSSFTMHMKRIIAELDEDNPDAQVGTSNQNGSISGDDLLIRKRKGKSVLQEEYDAEKTKSAKLFMQLSQKIEQLQFKSRQFDPILYRNTSAINKLTLTVDSHETELFKLGRDLKEVRAFINNTEQRLMTQIFNKTSDNVWQIKLSSFQSKHVIPRFQNLSNQINKNQKENNRNFSDLQPKFIKINQSLTSLYTQTDNNRTQINSLSQTLNEISQKLIEQITIMQGKLDVVYNEKKVKIQKIHEKIDSQVVARIKEIENLNIIIKELSKNIEDKVVIGVKKNLDVKIHQIDKNIHTLSNKQKSIQEELFATKGEIHNIKQVLSKKANFTDILLHFERKADKQDFKQLKDRIETTTPSHLRSTIIDNPEKTRRTISASTRKRTSLSKNLINPVSILNEDKLSLESDNDMSSRMFIMGLESDMAFNSDRRRMSYTESTRRKKKMKPNAGLLNLFSNS